MQLVLAALASRHPLINARICVTGETPELVLQKPLGIELEVRCVEALTQEQLHAQVAAERGRAFDIEHGPLTRVQLYRTGEGSDLLLLSVHPIVADEWSVAVLLRDLVKHYDAEGSIPQALGEEPEYSFQDFAEWQHELLASAASTGMTDDWVNLLDGAPVGLQWPSSAKGGHDDHSRRGGVLGFSLLSDVSLPLMAFAAEQGLAVPDLLFAAYELTLHRFCHQPDLLVGYEFAGRDHAQTHDLVGRFANCLPLRSTVEPGMTFLGFLSSSIARVDAAQRHQHLPFSRLSGMLEWPQGGSDVPRLSATFTALHFPAIDDEGFALFQLDSSAPAVRFGNLFIESFAPPSWLTTRGHHPRRAASDLSLRIGEGRGRLVGEWLFDEAVLSLDSVQQLSVLYRDTLHQMITRPTDMIDLTSSADTMALHDTSGNENVSPRSLPRVRRADLGVPECVASDLILDPAIVPQGIAPVVDANSAQRILLTGATGFLGAFLLDELLNRTTAEIVCLVRAGEEVSAKRRVMKNLARYSLTPINAADRIRVIPGDLSQPLFGLSSKAFRQLATEIDVIYHNGAEVNLALPYGSLRESNVGGVREVLRFAAEHHTKPVHLVSTFTVHTTSENRGQLVTEDDPLPSFGKLLYGYSQTKWVGEHLVQTARQRGLPVTIYRPGHISGDSVTGASNSSDLLHTIVLICLRLGAAPERDVEFDLTPVDYVAKALVELSLQPESTGGDFHLTNPIPMQTRELTEWMQQSGLGVDIVPYDNWRDRLLAWGQQMGTDDMRILTDILGPRAFAEDNAQAVHPQFDTQRTQSGLKNSLITCPPPDTRLFDTYLSFLRRMNLIGMPDGEPDDLAMSSNSSRS